MSIHVDLGGKVNLGPHRKNKITMQNKSKNCASFTFLNSFCGLSLSQGSSAGKIPRGRCPSIISRK